MRKGQEGKLGGHDSRRTCANLAFPVEERPRRGARPRGREPPEPDRRGGAVRSMTESIGRANHPAIAGHPIS